MDTAPDFTGSNVKPNVVRNYQGGDIRLPGDSSRIIKISEHPDLADQIGHDIVTTDGTTLLGADDKAGIAEIMTSVATLVTNPDISHGVIKVLFTTDEEIGRGADKVDLQKLGADFGYTMDGGRIGEIDDETFSADGVTIDITGVAQHPGTSKGVMENAIKIASDIVARLPRDLAPETTEGREGFIHPVGISASMDAAHLEFIIRDFVDEGLAEKEALLRSIAEEVMTGYPGSTMRFTVSEQYRNMKQVLDRHPEIMDNLLEAVRRVGLEPVTSSIRGGTDGSRLSFMGLPCPNIYTGGHSYHSPLEWISVQDMQKSVDTIVELVKVWEERA
jgi:tripeptide aminopeptidase